MRSVCSLVLLVLAFSAFAQGAAAEKKVRTLIKRQYELPAVSYRISIINTTSVALKCSVTSERRNGGLYVISPGAQFNFDVETRNSVVELRCPLVRGGAELSQVGPSRRYIFGRVTALSKSKLKPGEIEFYEVVG